MKEGWEYKKLKDIATFTRGLTYSKNDEAEISNNIVLRSNNVDLSTGKLNFDELKYLKSEFSIPEEKRVKKGSLLMCMSNGSKIHLGKVALINEDYPYAFGGFMALVTPNEELNPQFFHYSLSSPEYKEFIKKLSEGANINNIKVKELELFTIPIPPLSEQQSIVDYLDSAFAKIDAMKANAEKALNEAKALFQASLKKMLEPKEGWEEKTLCTIVHQDCSLSYGIVQPGDHVENGIPVVRPVDFNNKVIVEIDGLKRTKKEISDAYKRTILKGGEILFCVRGTTGTMGLASKELNGCNVTRGIVPMFFNEETNLMFVYYQFLSPRLQDEIQKKTTGAALKQINIKDLRNLQLYLPSLSEQQSIVETLDSLKSKVDRLQENCDKISQESDALKQAILRQVFE